MYVTTFFSLAVVWLASALPTQPEGSINEKAGLQIEHRDFVIGDTEYAWVVVIPAGVEPGGAAILFLHGGGECGADGEKPLRVGLIPEMQREPDNWPFVVLVPQKPSFNSEWEDHEEALLYILDTAADEGLYDPARLAVTGLSQGGHGTIWFSSTHTDRVQAAAPVCGYVDRRFSKEGIRITEQGAKKSDPNVIRAAKALADTPVWIVHGGSDSVVPVEESRALSDALDEAQGLATNIYIEQQDVDHDVWLQAYADQDLSDWFAEHTTK